MSIVQEIYIRNIDISDLELAQEVLQYPKLEPIDLWLLPQYPFNVWRRKYDYPRLLENIKSRQRDFNEWMIDQGITDEFLLNGDLSDFFENKPLSTDLNKHLIRVSYKGKVNMQSWHKYKGEKSSEGDGEPVIYEYVKSYISYYDWKWVNKSERFNFVNEFDRHFPNTENEVVYLNGNIQLLKMGGMSPPVNSIGIMLRGKNIEFINMSGLKLHGQIHFGDMGNLEFNHCTVDNLTCDELEMPSLHFKNSSIKNVQIRNSNINSWLFYACNVTGNIIDSKLSLIRIFGGQFNPTFTNSEITDIKVKHKGFVFDDDFEKTYRALSKSAKESGNKKLASSLKISEYDFVREKMIGFEKLFMTLNKYYWGYGQKPIRLIKVSIVLILVLGIFYSFFPCNFSSKALVNESYVVILFNSLYFSVVTFTTLGYGDLSPIGFLKLFAGFEALFGVITLGFLVAGLTKND